MELRPGCKQSDVGVIPANWEVSPIGALITDFRGGASLKPSDFTGSGVKVLPKGAVGRKGWLNIEDSDRQYCSRDFSAAHWRNQVDETFTIVVLRDLVPSGPNIGLMVQIRDPEIFVLAQGVYGFKVNTGTAPGYLVQLSKTRWYRKLANSIMVGSTQVHITNTAFKRAQIPLPPLAEQETIADALSDVDALIESQEQLIAKKRCLKQGAMQELLTGKKRLANFSGNWETRHLGDIAPLQRGFDLPTSSLQQGPYPVVYSNGVLNHHVAFRVNGPGVVTGRSGTIGKVTFVEQNFWPHNTSLWVISFGGNDPKFVFYLFTQIGLERFATGSGVPTLNRNDVHTFKVNIPPLRAEQTAIVGFLSDMDNEIAALQAKLAKARQVKQGMMQELLTGRIRLVQTEP